jgi:hypothetical protein
MMGSMEREVLDRVGSVERRLVDLVDAYARRVYPAVLSQHDAGSVSSPLGVWLLLAAVTSASSGEDRRELERSLGCSAEQASELLAAFMSAPPPALKAAMAVWAAIADSTEAVGQWARRLPPEVETGFMPTQEEADAWADRTTDGLIKAFPMRIDEATRIVLTSALATRVSWSIPLDVVPAAEHLAEPSPWHGKVERLLWDDRPELLAKLVNTRSAGVVAVHFAAAVEGVTVISVSAEPGCPRGAVLEAAHEIVALVRGEEAPPACSLFDLALGPGHSWNIRESAIPTWTAGERIERIAGVSLPAWTTESTLDLKRSETFGAEAALDVVRQLIGPRPDDQTGAGQAAVASFTRFGFEAAAITVFGVACSASAPPPETGLERVATLRFDHPYAAIAVAGHAATREHNEESSNSRFAGLPLFTAWIDTPAETSDEDPPD